MGVTVPCPQSGPYLLLKGGGAYFLDNTVVIWIYGSPLPVGIRSQMIDTCDKTETVKEATHAAYHTGSTEEMPSWSQH
jgi:hypothetical protein